MNAVSLAHSLQESFNNRLSQFLQAHTHVDTLVLAFSGGLDSRVLLQLAMQFVQSSPLAGRDLRLRALHVNHGLHPCADEWQSFCEAVCRQYACEFHAARVRIDTGRNLEEQARHLRYQYFESMCAATDVLLTAHHRDDQIETILFRLFRGAGPAALAGMPVCRDLGQTVLYRPLLEDARVELLQYAREHDLQWVEDESNRNEHFSRNFLRHSILPLLRERWPHVDTSILRSAGLLAEQTEVVEALAKEHFDACSQAEGVNRMRRWGDCISLPALLTLSQAQQAQLLRFWLKQKNLKMPTRQQLLGVIELCHASDTNTHAQVSWHDRSARLRVCWRVYDQHLFLLDEGLDSPAPETSSARLWQAFEDGPVVFGGRQYFTGKAVGVGLGPDLDVLQVRQRKGGERCKPFGRSHSQSLKKLLQEYRVPPWQRDYLPLFYYRDALVAVADLWLCDEFVSHDEAAWCIESAPCHEGIACETMGGDL